MRMLVAQRICVQDAVVSEHIVPRAFATDDHHHVYCPCHLASTDAVQIHKDDARAAQAYPKPLPNWEACGPWRNKGSVAPGHRVGGQPGKVADIV